MIRQAADFCEIVKNYGFDGLKECVFTGNGFSFNYGEVSSSEWRQEFSLESIKTEEMTDYNLFDVKFKHNKSSLEVYSNYKLYKKFEVIEYRLTFKNGGDENLPPIKDISSLDFTMDLSTAGEPIIHSLSSGACPWIYPANHFKHQEFEIYPDMLNPRKMPYWAGEMQFSKKHIDDKNSYTSADLPFLFLQDRMDESGMFLALGWEGDWKITIQKSHSDLNYRLSGGVPGINIALYPGESITGPTVFIGAYKGDVFNGSNALRAFIDGILMKDIQIKKNDVPPVTYDHWFGYKLKIDDKLMYELADISKEAGIEYFIIDAGWYEGVTDVLGGYTHGIGTWTVDKKKFPDGLKPVSDYVRKNGMKFGIWISPEKPWKTSAIALKHPEWMLSAPGLGNHILNLCDKDARQWYKDTVAAVIEEAGLDWIRLEPFMSRYKFWEANDNSEDRKGMTQLKYIEGLYEVWNWIQETYPNLVVELLTPSMVNMDVIRYTDQMLISDMNMNPHILRAQFHGLNRVIPGGYVCGMFDPATLDYEDYPDYYYHSYFAGALQINDPLTQYSKERLEVLKKHVRVYKRIRHLINKNFYLPFGDPLTLHQWQGWQFYDENSNEGVVTAFRTRSKESRVKISLQGILSDRNYILEEPYSGKCSKISGEELLDAGLAMELPENGSGIIYYYAERS